MGAAEGGAIAGYALVGMLVGALAVGALTDRTGRRKVVLGATVWFARRSRAVCGRAEPGGVRAAPVHGFVASSYPARIRATGLGWTVGFSRLGGSTGPAAAGLVLASGAGVAWNFWFFAVFSFAAALLLLAPGRTDTPDVGLTRRACGTTVGRRATGPA